MKLKGSLKMVLSGAQNLWKTEEPSIVILEPEKRESVTVSTFHPSTFHEVMAPDAIIFVFFFFF